MGAAPKAVQAHREKEGLKDGSVQMVTLPYRAPELLMGNLGYSFPVDLWSFGCLLAEIAGSSFHLGSGADEPQSSRAMLKALVEALGPPGEDELPGVRARLREELGALGLPWPWPRLVWRLACG